MLKSVPSEVLMYLVQLNNGDPPFCGRPKAHDWTRHMHGDVTSIWLMS